MLRYFYLLCLLLAIKCTLCYDYISDHNLDHKQSRRLSNKQVLYHKHKGDGKRYEYRKRNFDTIDREPVAQLDLASFIQKPDEYATDNVLFEAESKKSGTNINIYNDYGFQSEYNTKEDIAKRSNKRPYYLSPSADKPADLVPNPYPNKDTINSRHLNLDSVSSHGLNNGKIARNLRGKGYADSYKRIQYDEDGNLVHNPKKKCALKDKMKIPFFFHNKTETTKSKKAKKRKSFCFNCSKQEKENKEKSEMTTELQDLKENTNKQTTPKVPIGVSNGNSDVMKNNRLQRNKRYNWHGDRDRQLKELEEILKNVDNVDILPKYEKLPEERDR